MPRSGARHGDRHGVGVAGWIILSTVTALAVLLLAYCGKRVARGFFRPGPEYAPVSAKGSPGGGPRGAEEESAAAAAAVAAAAAAAET